MEAQRRDVVDFIGQATVSLLLEDFHAEVCTVIPVVIKLLLLHYYIIPLQDFEEEDNIDELVVAAQLLCIINPTSSNASLKSELMAII